VIVTPVDDGEVAELDGSRRAAIALAKLSGARLYLVDRVGASWTLTPHGEGPVDRDTLVRAGGEAAHMIPQLDEAIAAGVDVRAWRLSLPGIGGFDDAVDQLGADLAVSPTDVKGRGWTARFRQRSASERAHERCPQVPMIGVDQDGSLRLM